MSRASNKRKPFREWSTFPPVTIWGQAVSRLTHEQEQGYEGLSLLLLLFESVLDVRLDDEDEQPEPWIEYRAKMNKPCGKTIESFALPRDPKMASKVQAASAAA